MRAKLAARPEIAPKPKVIIQKPAQDVVAMEGVIAQLRLENSELQRQMQGSEDVIMGLRRDLAGASAKLTDMTGMCMICTRKVYKNVESELKIQLSS